MARGHAAEQPLCCCTNNHGDGKQALGEYKPSLPHLSTAAPTAPRCFQLLSCVLAPGLVLGQWYLAGCLLLLWAGVGSGGVRRFIAQHKPSGILQNKEKVLS